MPGSALFVRSVYSSVTGVMFGTLIETIILHAGVTLTADQIDIV